MFYTEVITTMRKLFSFLIQLVELARFLGILSLIWLSHLIPMRFHTI